MERLFKARTQGNNFKGSSAADESDSHKPEKWLRDNKYLNDGEFVIGIDFSFQENNEENESFVNVQFLAFKSEDFESITQKINDKYDPLVLRKIEVQMNSKEFLFLFNHINVTLSLNGVLEGRDIKYIE